MKTNPTKKGYQKPKVAQIKLDTEISLVMTSPPPPNPQMPQAPGGLIQKIFKFGA
jgi:hypothetical protein